MQYVYIMGRGHSGSTVLDATLGHTSSVESVGELVSGMSRFNAPCSCGLAMRDCSYWAEIRHRFELRAGRTWEDAASKIASQAHVRNILSNFARNRDELREVADITTHLAHSVSEVSGKSVMLDSSKTPSRALFLVRQFPEARVIHLVRHPEAILASNYWRIQAGTGFKFLRRTYRDVRLMPLFLTVSALSWLLGSILAEVVKISRPSQVLLVRYEDIASDPEGQFCRLSKFLDVDVMEGAIAIVGKQPIPFGHNIGGNYVRMRKTFTFETKKSNNHSLPKPYGVVAKIICWPLMLRYGYTLFRTKT